ncbi:rod shape-determining protein MreC [Candidatus Kaiserbacteria bacterium]|nr:rod shape-determining protein MreC [Candidatus Kaiserbacteria bacterium]
MRKTFLARRNALLSSTRASWGAFALACAVLVLLMRLVAPNLFWHAAAPVFRAADALAAASRSFFSGFRNATILTLENERLARENAALGSENRALLQQASSIAALIGAESSAEGLRGVVAGVVARPPTSPYDTLIIARGAKAGITAGQEAFADGGVPIGVVSAVFPDFSRVTLFSAPGMRVDGWIGPRAVPVTLRGAGGGTLRASLPRSVEVKAGDAVFVPGPGALPIGNVARVDDDPLLPVITIHIQPATNLFSLTWLELRGPSAELLDAIFQATSTLP